MNKDLGELKKQEDHFKKKEEELAKKDRVRGHTQRDGAIHSHENVIIIRATIVLSGVLTLLYVL